MQNLSALIAETNDRIRATKEERLKGALALYLMENKQTYKARIAEKFCFNVETTFDDELIQQLFSDTAYNLILSPLSDEIMLENEYREDPTTLTTFREFYADRDARMIRAVQPYYEAQKLLENNTHKIDTQLIEDYANNLDEQAIMFAFLEDFFSDKENSLMHATDLERAFHEKGAGLPVANGLDQYRRWMAAYDYFMTQQRKIRFTDSRDLHIIARKNDDSVARIYHHQLGVPKTRYLLACEQKELTVAMLDETGHQGTVNALKGYYALHGVANTPDADLIPSLESRQRAVNSMAVSKIQFSPTYAIKMDRNKNRQTNNDEFNPHIDSHRFIDYVIKSGVNNIVIGGTCTSVCVKEAALAIKAALDQHNITHITVYVLLPLCLDLHFSPEPESDVNVNSFTARAVTALEEQNITVVKCPILPTSYRAKKETAVKALEIANTAIQLMHEQIQEFKDALILLNKWKEKAQSERYKLGSVAASRYIIKMRDDIYVTKATLETFANNVSEATQQAEIYSTLACVNKVIVDTAKQMIDIAILSTSDNS